MSEGGAIAHGTAGQTGPRQSLLVRTALTAALIGAFSVAAANYLADRTEAERRTLARLAGLIGEEPADTLTTGSITRAAAGTRLDPCAAEPARRR